MGSSGKRKTTMAKVNRERKMQERRQDKAARRERRRNGESPVAWDSPENLANAVGIPGRDPFAHLFPDEDGTVPETEPA